MAGVTVTGPTIGIASTVSTTSYTLGAFTPTANSILVCFVNATGTLSTTTTMTGGGLTWILQSTAAYNTVQTPTDTMYCFTAIVGGVPVSTTPTFNIAVAPTGANMCIAQITGININVVQVSPTIGSGSASTSFISQPTTISAKFIGYAGGLTTAGTTAAPTNYTLLDNIAYITPSSNMATAFNNGTDSNKFPAFTTTTTNFASMAVEVGTTLISIKRFGLLGIG